jgi:hypothetical protein
MWLDGAVHPLMGEEIKMTALRESAQSGYVPPSPHAKKQRRWVKPVILTVAGIALLLTGVGIGAAGSSSGVTSDQHQVARLKSRLASANAGLKAAQANLSAAQTAASNAQSTALSQVKGQYKAKFAALRRQEQQVASLQRKLRREQGVVAASTISADGVYVVGKDIPAGIYHTSGGAQCYYATLGSTDTFNIQDNNNFNGPETVDVFAAYAFQISGGCTWHKVG